MGDSWEQQIAADTNGQSSSLNPNANEFVPNIPVQASPIEVITEAVEDLSINEDTEVVEPIESDSIHPLPEDTVEEEDEREHLNVVFIGHVDAGKSTLGGQILFLTGNVDERTIQKYEKYVIFTYFKILFFLLFFREAKDKNRDSWYMAYIMDINDEEREKGKTVEVGRAHFATEKRRYTILDAPGHKNYVPNMISGTAQADIGVMVIAARKGEFETGFERGGQTREHAQLAKTLGVAKLIVAVNKMDDTSILLPNGQWSEDRFREVESRLGPFLKSCGYNPKKDITFVPISALSGQNVKDSVEKQICPWWKQGSLFDVLDTVEVADRDPLGPFRMSILDRYKDMGVIVMGKSESGTVCVGDSLLVMPNKQGVRVEAIFRDEKEVSKAAPGENLRLKISGVEDTDLSPGFVLSSVENCVPVVRQFEAQLMVLDLLEHKAIFTAGYKAVLHIHSLVEECEVTKLLAEINLKNKEQKKTKFVKSNTMAICRIGVEQGICIEEFSQIPQLGRFTLRDEGHTIAVGKVTKLPKNK
eukprot:g8043.t1